ncbi:MAG: hypothetical protein ISS23_00685 [Nanoarchaeota archaeon]|nr:hypothetical protein [Nanoarchaeota archaeon]
MNVAEKRMLNYDKKRGLILSESYSPQLAELIGIIFGDGHLSKAPKYTIEICGHSIDDYEYHTIYLRILIQKLFGIKTKIAIRKNANCMLSQIFSKRVINFLEDCGLKTGRKKELPIPDWIRKEDINMRSFLRGFVDTDGSLALKKRYRSIAYYPVVGLVSKSETLVRHMADWLRKKGFSLWAGYDKQIDKRSGNVQEVYRIYLNGHKQLIRWVNFIGFDNQKHIQKYKIWKERNKEKLFKLSISTNLHRDFNGAEYLGNLKPLGL